MATVMERRDAGVGTGRATGGVVGIFAAIGLGLGLLAIIAAYALGDVTNADGDAGDARDAAGGISTGTIAIFTLVSIPLVALIAGVFAGIATRDTGRGALSALLGTLVGIFVYVIVVGIGIAVGAGAAGAGVPDVEVNIPQNLQDQLGFIGSVAGLSYLVANLIIAGVAGAIVGAIMPEYGFRSGAATGSTYGTTGTSEYPERESVYTDRDRVADRPARERVVDRPERDVPEEDRGPVRI